MEKQRRYINMMKGTFVSPKHFIHSNSSFLLQTLTVHLTVLLNPSGFLLKKSDHKAFVLFLMAPRMLCIFKAVESCIHLIVLAVKVFNTPTQMKKQCH